MQHDLLDDWRNTTQWLWFCYAGGAEGISSPSAGEAHLAAGSASAASMPARPTAIAGPAGSNSSSCSGRFMPAAAVVGQVMCSTPAAGALPCSHQHGHKPSVAEDPCHTPTPAGHQHKQRSRQQLQVEQCYNGMIEASKCQHQPSPGSIRNYRPQSPLQHPKKANIMLSCGTPGRKGLNDVSCSGSYKSEDGWDAIPDSQMGQTFKGMCLTALTADSRQSSQRQLSGSLRSASRHPSLHSAASSRPGSAVGLGLKCCSDSWQGKTLWQQLQQDSLQASAASSTLLAQQQGEPSNAGSLCSTGGVQDTGCSTARSELRPQCEVTEWLQCPNSARRLSPSAAAAEQSPVDGTQLSVSWEMFGMESIRGVQDWVREESIWQQICATLQNIKAAEQSLQELQGQLQPQADAATADGAQNAVDTSLQRAEQAQGMLQQLLDELRDRKAAEELAVRQQELQEQLQGALVVGTQGVRYQSLYGTDQISYEELQDLLRKEFAARFECDAAALAALHVPRYWVLSDAAAVELVQWVWEECLERRMASKLQQQQQEADGGMQPQQQQLVGEGSLMTRVASRQQEQQQQQQGVHIGQQQKAVPATEQRRQQQGATSGEGQGQQQQKLHDPLRGMLRMHHNISRGLAGVIAAHARSAVDLMVQRYLTTLAEQQQRVAARLQELQHEVAEGDPAELAQQEYEFGVEWRYKLYTLRKQFEEYKVGQTVCCWDGCGR